MSPSGSSDDQGGLAARSPGDAPAGRRADPTGGRCEDQDREAIHSADDVRFIADEAQPRAALADFAAAGRAAAPGGDAGDQDREAIHSAAAAGASWDGTSTSGAIGSSENRSPVRACEMPVVRTMVRPVYSGYSWLTEA